MLEADSRFMERALALAMRGCQTTMPNPRVGCVIVKQGEIVGEGWHERPGEPHAEVYALNMAGEKAQGATVYITLEPCSYFGRTPPCTDALIAAGVAKVVMAMKDPNPQVSGFECIQSAGIAVELGIMANAARELNIGYICRMEKGRPWLRIKTGCSLDGRTALMNGQSKWITSHESRLDAQKLRARSCAILTGIGTLLADDPQLTVRDLNIEQPLEYQEHYLANSFQPRQPLRVVLDSHLRTPLTAHILSVPGVLIVCSTDSNYVYRKQLECRGAEIIALPGTAGHIDLSCLLAELANRGCNEVTVEAGAQLVGSLVRGGWVDEWILYQAPIIIGDTARGIARLDPVALEPKYQPLWVKKSEIGPDLKWILRFSE